MKIKLIKDNGVEEDYEMDEEKMQAILFLIYYSNTKKVNSKELQFYRRMLVDALEADIQKAAKRC